MSCQRKTVGDATLFLCRPNVGGIIDFGQRERPPRKKPSRKGAFSAVALDVLVPESNQQKPDGDQTR